jgi:hypothetical protein
MRTAILAITAMVAVSYSAPAFAQVRTYNDCWEAAEKLGGAPGGAHTTFIQRCMAGKGRIAGVPAPQKPTPELRKEFRTFGACQTLAEARIGPGGTHREFIKNCMTGKQN